ncbi:MAG: hypothetical protein WBN39_00770 [Flavobacteriaceae bacterium]
MNRLKELKYFTLIMLLFAFVAAGSLSACRDKKEKEGTEQAGEHPEGEEHPTEAGEAGEEHPEAEEHPEGNEHPEGEEHPKDSVSG